MIDYDGYNFDHAGYLDMSRSQHRVLCVWCKEWKAGIILFCKEVDVHGYSKHNKHGDETKMRENADVSGQWNKIP